MGCTAGGRKRRRAGLVQRNAVPKNWYRSPAWKALRRELQSRLSRGRRSHCIRTAETARRLAQAWGEEEGPVYMAGLLHDIAREMDGDELVFWARQDGSEDAGEQGRGLLHGPAGAGLLPSLGITDAPVLEAVRRHTTGAPGMGPAAAAVYVADHIEPGRRNGSAGQTLRWLAMGRAQALRAALGESVGHVRKKNLPVHPLSLALMEELNGMAGKGKKEKTCED